MHLSPASPTPLASLRQLAALGVLLLAGCASKPSYDIDYSDSFDFASLHNYRWYDDMYPSEMADYRQYNSSDKRVRNYVDRELQRRGFSESRTAQPDFLVNYSISKQDQMRIDSFSGYPQGVHGGMGVGTYGAGVSIGYSSGPSVKHYQEGTVVLDVIDARSSKIVWRGVAEGKLKDSLTQKDKNRIASEVSQALLQDFPPRPGQ